MSVFLHELIKIVSAPLIMGYVLLCLLLNAAVAYSCRDDFAIYIAEVSHQTGYVMGPEFDARAAVLEDSTYAIWLRDQTQSAQDVFEGYTTAYIGEAYIRALGLSGITADLMRDKYARLQDAADELHESGAGMTLYFAGMTYYKHNQLFGAMMAVLLVEGILLGALITFLSIGYEHNAGTEALAYSTKKGRRVIHPKLAASLTASLGVYAAIAGISLAVYLTLNPFGGTWSSSVSSGFNYIRDMMSGGSRPFITWHAFTIGGYLAASIAVSAALVVCFVLMAYIAGLWTKNGYIGFIVLALINFAVLVLLQGGIFGRSLLTYALTTSPIWTVLEQSNWFTDGASNHLLPHFETYSVTLSLALLTALSYVTWRCVRRRNLV